MGGPKREFWCLLSRDIIQTMFEGVAGHYILKHDSVGLMVSKTLHIFH